MRSRLQLRSHRLLIYSVVVLAVIFTGGAAELANAEDSPAVEYLKREGRAPSDYVLSKFRDHRIVIIGENHWLKHDVSLVLDLIPQLGSRGVTALGVEMFRVSDQETIDRVTNADSWDSRAAMKVLRTAEWPYREYFEIIHVAWKINHELPIGGERLKLFALGPDTDWRAKLLPLGQTYDTFMAKTVGDYLKQPDRRILIYCGAHHSFTRFYQPELPRAERVEQFIDRMGNILWRGFGEDVFTITLHRPWQCHVDGKWGRCLPLDGAIDCAASPVRRPVGFDVARSPFAEMKVAPESLYGHGYSSLRLVDMTDGYIWSMPIEEYRGVEVIPLAEFAPDPASLDYVSQNNPFSDKKGLSRVDLDKLAGEEDARLRNFVKASGWESLAGWRQHCKN